MAEINKTITDIQSKVEARMVDLVKTVAEKLDDVLPDKRPSLPKQVPAPAEVIDRSFASAQKRLNHRHAFVKALYNAASPLVPSHAKPVKVATSKKIAA